MIGRRHVPHLEPVVDDVAAPPTVGLRDGALDVAVRRAEVVPRREARPGAADDDDRDVAVAVGPAQLVEQRAAQGVVECVALRGPVQRQAPNTRQRVVDEQHIVGCIAGIRRSSSCLGGAFVTHRSLMSGHACCSRDQGPSVRCRGLLRLSSTRWIDVTVDARRAPRRARRWWSQRGPRVRRVRDVRHAGDHTSPEANRRPSS